MFRAAAAAVAPRGGERGKRASAATAHPSSAGRRRQAASACARRSSRPASRGRAASQTTTRPSLLRRASARTRTVMRSARRLQRATPRAPSAVAAASGASNSCRTIPNASSPSSSPPRAVSTLRSAVSASARASANSLVFPIPALPSTTTSRPSPSCTAPSIASSAATSASRSNMRTADGPCVTSIANATPRIPVEGARRALATDKALQHRAEARDPSKDRISERTATSTRPRLVLFGAGVGSSVGSPRTRMQAVEAQGRFMHSDPKGIPMSASIKSFGRGRAAGLVLIALVGLGLAYLHFSGGSASVSVPSGAHAGQLTLKHCTYANEPADCGTLVVPENRHNAHSRLIALPITRIRAHTANPEAPIFRLQGGPGLTNMDFPDAHAVHRPPRRGARRLPRRRRIITPRLPRGRRRRSSTRATCSALRHSQPMPTPTAPAPSGSRTTGVDLAGYSLPERVDDLELARKTLGYGPVDLVSESAGTRTAMIYAWRYPKSIHRSVMISANPPGHYLFDAKTTGEQIRRYAALCAQAQRLPQPHPRPRGFDPFRLRQDPQPLLVPADQEGQRPGNRILRPEQQHRRRRWPDCRPADDRHAPLDRQGQRRRRRLAALHLRSNRIPARAGLGRRRRRRTDRRRPRQAAVRDRSRPRLTHREPRQRTALGRRPPARRLAGQPGREGIQQRPQLQRAGRCWSAASSTSPRRRRPRPASSSPTSRTGTRSCCRTSATPTTSGPTNRTRPPA